MDRGLGRKGSQLMTEPRRVHAGFSRRQFLGLLGIGASASLLAACQPAPAAPAPTPTQPAGAPTVQPTAAPAAPKPATTAAPQPAAAPTGGALTIAVTFDPDTLDPPNILSPGPEQITMLVFDRVTEIGPDMAIRPGLAESWTSDQAAEKWTFKLRRGAQFHDGTPVDVAAVVSTVERVLDEKKPVKQRGLYTGIKTARAVDPTTVEITTNGPFGALPYLLATNAMAILSPKAVKDLGDDFARRPVGSGPFSFQEWASGERVVLRRNPQYWGGAPRLDSITYRNVPEASTRVAMLETGQADIAQHLPPEEMKRLGTNQQIQILKVPSLEARDMRFNMLDERFKDLRVRQAMNYALNIPEIIDAILLGSGTFTGGPVPPLIPGGLTATKYKYDPALAKRLLADAGYPNGFKATVWGAKGTAAGLNEMLQAVQAQWRAIGVDVTMDLREVPAFVALSSKGPEEAESSGKQIISLGLSARYPDADNYLRNAYHSSRWSPAGNNRGFYKNERFDQLLDEGVKTSDSAKRENLYREAQQILVEDAPAAFLYTSDLIFGARRNVQGVTLLPTQHLLLAGASKS